MVLGGGIYWADGTVTTLCATLPSAEAADLGLGPYQRAFLLSSLLIGKLVGNFTNFLSDRWLGRRLPILLGYVLSVAALVVASFAQHYATLTACWMLAGIGLGFGCPAWGALSTECSPVSHRMLMGGASHLWFSLSSLCILLTILLRFPELKFGPHWRELLQWFSLPCGLFTLAALTVSFVESPHVLAAQGDAAAARRELEAMRRQNGREDVPVEFEVAAPAAEPRKVGAWAAAGLLFARQLRLVTAVVCATTFLLNFAGYGSGYSMPILLPALELGLPPAAFLCLNPVGDFVGVCLGVLGSRVLGRRLMIVAYLCGAAALNLAFLLGLQNLESPAPSSHGKAAVLTAVVCVPVVMGVGWLIVYVYVTEAFPTLCRSFACGFTIGCGRLGSIVAPLVFEHMGVLTGGHGTFFGVICVLLATNATLVLVGLPETKGRPIEESLTPPPKGGGEEEPLKA